MFDLKCPKNLSAVRVSFSGRNRVQAELYVLPGSEVWKEREILNHIADLSLPRSDVSRFFRIKNRTAANGDSSFIRTIQSSNAIEDRCLSSARGAEQYGKARIGAEMNIQVKRSFLILKAPADANFETRTTGGRRLRYWHLRAAHLHDPMTPVRRLSP